MRSWIFSALIESLDTGQIHDRPHWRQAWQQHSSCLRTTGKTTSKQSVPTVAMPPPATCGSYIGHYPAPAEVGQLLGPQAGTLIARLTIMRIFPPTPPKT